MNPQADSTPPLLRWNGTTPLLMSLVVIGMIVADLVRHGLHAPRYDEGTADHIAILLMFGQIPIMASFAMAGRHEWRRARPVLTLQVALWGLTYALSLL